MWARAAAGVAARCAALTGHMPHLLPVSRTGGAAEAGSLPPSPSSPKGCSRSCRATGRDSRIERALKTALVLLLAAAVAISGSLSYTLGHSAELRSLWRAFDAAAAETQKSFQEQINLKVLASVMGAKYIATLPDASSGAGVFESGFQAIGEDLLTITQSSSFNWIVVVLDAQRAAFEASAVAAAQIEDPSGVTAAQVAAYGIRDYNASTRTFHRAPQAPLYVVRWSTSPRGDPSLLANHLQNLYTDAFRKPVLDHVLSANATFMTPIVPGLVKDVTAKLSPPSCIVYAPTWTDPQWGVYNAQPAINNNTSSTIGRAICASGFHMDTVLSAAVPRSIGSALLVLLSPDGLPYSFTWDGTAAAYSGPGDRHAELLPRWLQKEARSFTASATGDTWSITLYPTPALVGQFVSSSPRNTAMAVISASLACVLLFCMYEVLVRRRASYMNKELRVHVAQLTKMKQDVEDGCEREAQAQARKLAEEAGIKLKEQFVAMVSHEIRTPLNAMSGAAALLAGTSPLTEEQLSLLALLDAAADTIIVVIDDILQTSALSSGNFPILREPLILARDVLEPAWRMTMLQSARREKLASLQLSRHVAPDVPECIMGDATRLLQVITNLLSNSIKFTPEGGAIELRVDVVDAAADLLMEAEMRVDIEPPATLGRLLRIQVVDTGIGIEPANLHKILEPFTQESAATRRKYGGTGLGLTICTRIASAMGGTLSAASAGRDLGATLSLVIPLQEAVTPPGSPATPLTGRVSTPDEAAPPPPPDERPPMRVLVAEDDALCAAVMRKILQRLRVEGTVVGDGVAAVDAYRAADPPFHLILLDIHMPLMDGLEASRAIAALAASSGRQPTPVVALTASCSDEEKQRCAAAGMVGHVAKPVRLDVLRALFLRYDDEHQEG